MTDDETARQSAHVLLDALSAFDDLSNPSPDEAIRLSLRRLEDVGAVAVLRDADTNDVKSVDIQPVLHAALNLLAAATVLRMRDNPDVTGIEMIEDLRAVVDGM